MTRRALIVMAKQPLAGQTKTRLTPPLSADDAAGLYRCLLLDTLEVVRRTAHQVPLTPYIAYYPPQAQDDFHALAPDFHLLLQQGPTLSERLAGALLAVQAQGYEQVSAMNSDSPALPVSYLTRAYHELDDPGVDVVLGPCDDGGYYLIGWRRPQPHLVLDVTMSTPAVLADTLALAERDGLHAALLPPWYDIDDASDLARLRANGHAGPHVAKFIRRSKMER